jgi:hypothetical protein
MINPFTRIAAWKIVPSRAQNFVLGAQNFVLGARTYVVAAAGLAVGLGLLACPGERLSAGGGSGIENPALILAFRDPDGRPLPVTGRLRLFPERSGWKDSGLYVRELHGQDTAMIAPRDLQALPPGILSPDSLSPDSSLALNLIVSGNGVEGMLGGFRLRSDGSRGYALERSDSGGETGSRAEVANVVLGPPERSYTGSIPAEYVEKGFRVVFVPGSPYFALVNLDGSLLFPILPQGTFPVRAAAFSPLSDTLITFYCTPDSLSTDSPFAPGRWEICPP